MIQLRNAHVPNEHGDIHEVYDVGSDTVIGITQRVRLWGTGPGAPRGGIRWITSTDGTVINVAKTRKESVAKFLEGETR